MEVTEETKKQVRSQKSTVFKLKFQTAEIITSVLAGVRRICCHGNTTRVLAFFWYQSLLAQGIV